MPHFSRPLREVGLVDSKEERGTVWEFALFQRSRKNASSAFYRSLLALAWALSAQAPTPAFDLVITNGHIIDGTGDGNVVAIT